jgi:hypothetical protein
MDYSRTLEGLNLLVGNAGASLTTGATTVTTANAIGGASGQSLTLDGVLLSQVLAAGAQAPVYVAPDGISVAGSQGYPLVPPLVPYAGAMINGQPNVGAYGQRAIVAFGLMLARVASQPLSLAQIFNPSGNQLDNSGNSTGDFALSGVTINGTGGAGSFAFTSGQTLAVGQQVQVSGTNTGTGSITGYQSPSTYLVTTGGAGTFTLKNLQNGAIVTSAVSGGTLTGLTFKVLNTFASLTPIIGAVVGPVTNVDKNFTMMAPGDAIFPYIPDNFVLIGYADVTVPYSAAAFTPGINNWSAAGVAATFINASSISKRSRQIMA